MEGQMYKFISPLPTICDVPRRFVEQFVRKRRKVEQIFIEKSALEWFLGLIFENSRILFQYTAICLELCFRNKKD